MNKLISNEYKNLNAKLHQSNPWYGTSAQHWKKEIDQFINEFLIMDAIDYGCGKGKLKKLTSINVTNYDPAIPQYDIDIKPADAVFCLDVLEHIEPENLFSVIRHIADNTKKAALFTICTRESTKKLEDGRNSHLIIESIDWWASVLSRYFEIMEISEEKTGSYCLTCIKDQ